MSERDTNSLTPKEWISGIGALFKLFGVIVWLVFAWLFALDFYRSSRIEDIELPGGKFSSAMYDAQFCRSSPNYLIRGIYSSTRIGLWLDRVSFRSEAYVHAKDTLTAISAAQEYQRVGDEAAANQAIEDAQSRLRRAMESYVASTCFDAEIKRRTY